MWTKLVELWKRLIKVISDSFVWQPPDTDITPTEPGEPLEPAPVVDPDISVPTDGLEAEESDEEIIVKAIWASELKDLTPQELDELAALFYENDPDVEIVDISAGDPEAGEHHGSNTEEDMMGTYDPNQEYVDEPWEE